ncbi:MAG: hypothetical protein M3545_15625, partial [Acidobacteriota bacterium]|nr:hypothetical protein [Acidobacteriota bacterium]
GHRRARGGRPRGRAPVHADPLVARLPAVKSVHAGAPRLARNVGSSGGPAAIAAPGHGRFGGPAR